MSKNDNTGDTNDGTDAPLIDLNEGSIKKLIARAKRRGVITYDELNEALPQDQMSSEQIEDIMAAISEMGVNIVESDEDADKENDDDREAEAEDEADEVSPRVMVDAAKKKETIERTDDPVRMYLREMGAVELLSREGEIAIAKRIEAGRDMMILGLCESPITFHAIIQWSEALNAGEMQLREILDLDAMLSKEPAPEALNEDGEGDDDGEISEKTAGPTIKEEEDEPEEASADGEEEDDMVERRAKPQAEEEDDENALSLAQMEETLKPQALEKFATITALFKKFSKLQASRLDALQSGAEFPASDEK
jgi:RNA polymerase primary sigma factor